MKVLEHILTLIMEVIIAQSYLEIYATDTYGQNTTKSFTYKDGDIIEFEWNGPLKKFTTTKISTGEKYL